MSLSDRHLLLVSRGLLPLPPNSGPVPRCHMSHPRDAGVRDSAKHAEAQGGRVTYSRTRTQAGTGSMTSVPALPSGPLLLELLVGSPAQGRTGRTSVGPAQALPCVCQGNSRAGSLCAQLCAGCLHRHPLNSPISQMRKLKLTEWLQLAPACLSWPRPGPRLWGAGLSPDRPP